MGRKKKNGGAKPRTAGWMEDAFRSLWPPVRSVLPWLVAVGVLGGALVFAADAIRKDVSGRVGFQIDTATLAQRHYVGPLKRPVTVAPKDLPPFISALDRGAAARIAQAFQANPWVERVQSVKVMYPNVPDVQLIVRQPVVAVKVGNAYGWVDYAGVRLPGVLDQRTVTASGLLVVRGVSGPVPAEGKTWDEPGVRAGAETAIVLGREAVAYGIGIIDVTNINGRHDPRSSEIVLVNVKGTRILWGRPPSTDKPGELTREQKLRQLQEAHRRRLLDTGSTIDIRFPDLLRVQPPA